MDQEVFIALLNPAISLVLAITFLSFWFILRARLYLLALAAGYVLSASGFLFQRFDAPFGFHVSRMLSVCSFALAASLVTAAVCLRYGRRVPYLALGLLAGGGVAAFTWFMFGDPNLTWRIYTVNFALGGVCALAAFELRAVPDRRTVDTLLYAGAVLSAANFFARTIAVVAMHGVYDTYEGFYTSLYWTSLLLSHAVLALSIALCLIVAVSLDVFAELKAESRTDPLSGLLNRRGLEDRGRTLSDAVGFSLVMADLDHFKSVNDRHGHQVGDEVIAAFARLLKKSSGKSAIVARTGGEEFVVLFPGCELPAAQSFAETVRATFSAAPLPGAASAAGQVTCSFGVAQGSRGEPLEAVLNRADESLMHAKRGGRDRVRVSYVRPEPRIAA